MPLPLFTRQVDDPAAHTPTIYDAHASVVNEMMDELEPIAGSTPHARYTNVQTLSGNKVLTDADLPFQSLDANGADRNVQVPPTASTNHPFYIWNRTGATYKIVIQANGGGSTLIIILPGTLGIVIPDGTNGYKGGVWVPNPSGLSTDALRGDLTWGAVGGGGGDLVNYARNPAFEYVQRYTPGTLHTIPDKKYGPDGWWVTRENADVQGLQSDATGETGLTCNNFYTFKKITNNGKLFVCCPITSPNAIPLRNQLIEFQLAIKASAAMTLRMAVLELQTGGTKDAPPATLVTAFGTAGVDPTLGANVAVITGAQSKSVTTGWQTFNVPVTVPAASKNLFLAIWSNSQMAVNDTLSVAQAGLFGASTIQTWKCPLATLDRVLCQAHYEKTFDINIAPGTATALGKFDSRSPVAAMAYVTMSWRYKVEKFKTPAVHCYDDAGTIDKCSYTTTTGGLQVDGSTVGVDDIGTSACRIYTDPTTSKCGIICNVTAEAEIL